MAGRRGFRALLFSFLLIQGCTVDRSGHATSMPDGQVPRPDAEVGDAGDAGGGGEDGGRDAMVEPPDGCVPGPELCNGVDDDCDPSTEDGADEPTLGDACDGPDADLCAEGATICTGGALACDDTTGDATELCNGMDDDCDPSTADGADDPMVGAACDGSDADLCTEGTNACMGGGLVCDDTTGDAAELCNGTDDDCDPSTADGADDPAVGVACDGEDTDMCVEGTTVCSSGGVVCDDTTGDDVETCDGTDEDSDGSIDEGAGCPCDRRTRMGRSYLFCGTGGDRSTFLTAAAFCAARGYDLVRIDDAAENAWVAGEMAGIRSDRDWWIGATDAASEDTWLWTDLSAVTYDNWRASQPNDSGDCAEMDPGETVGSTLGSWNDAPCDQTKRFVCEAGP